MRLPVLRLKGSPHEIGYRHGQQAQDKIQHNLEVYFRRFKNETALSRDEALKRAERYLQVIRRVSPSYARAMEGVALGSKTKLLEITALNVRYELMYSQFAKIGLKPLPRVDGCTAFGAMPEATVNRHLLIAQNWAFHVRCSEILGSRTLSQAISRITRGGRSCSANFLIGQQTRLGVGKIVDIESAPEATGALSPENGVVAHTNHFSNPEQLGVKQVLDEERKSTLHRFARITQLLQQMRKENGKMSMTKAEEMLTDHDGKPESVCRHENLTFPTDERYRTVVSIVMDLYTGQLQTTLGSPCEREYQTLRL